MKVSVKYFMILLFFCMVEYTYGQNVNVSHLLLEKDTIGNITKTIVRGYDTSAVLYIEQNGKHYFTSMSYSEPDTGHNFNLVNLKKLEIDPSYNVNDFKIVGTNYVYFCGEHIQNNDSYGFIGFFDLQELLQGNMNAEIKIQDNFVQNIVSTNIDRVANLDKMEVFFESGKPSIMAEGITSNLKSCILEIPAPDMVMQNGVYKLDVSNYVSERLNDKVVADSNVTTKGIYYSQQTIDTLHLNINDRDSIYYYGCWIDGNENYNPATTKLEFVRSCFDFPRICANPFYVEDSLTVIGIASGGLKLVSHVPETPDDTLAEYFQLYEATDTSYVKVAEVRWDTLSSTDKCFEFIFHEEQGSGIRDYACIPVYEAYFESPIVVRDSFYVAFTQYNNGQWLELNSSGSYYVYNTKPTQVDVYTIVLPKPIDPKLIPCMPHVKVKFLSVEGDFYHTRYSWVDTTVWYTGYDSESYQPIFPIFDTTGYYRADTCADVTNFAVLGTDSISALLSWDSTGNSIGWELAYGPIGTLPDEANILEMSSTVHRLSGLDSGTWYVAYVRAKCNNGEYSNWSNGIEFYITGDTVSTPISIQTSLLEKYTHIMPNPANEVVTIFSSFSINRIEVFALNGVLVERMDCEGVSTQLTVTEYPKGVYIVKVYTHSGVATKKLVVN